MSAGLAFVLHPQSFCSSLLLPLPPRSGSPTPTTQYGCLGLGGYAPGALQEGTSWCGCVCSCMCVSVCVFRDGRPAPPSQAA